MRRNSRASYALLAVLFLVPLGVRAEERRLVVMKVDGVPARLIERYVAENDPQTGRAKLPWIRHIFEEEGSWVRNFYVRGISLSAPSWCTLDTGRHTVIHGNAEYDRYSGRVYDYLNFFPFYFNYARSRHADMPGVEVLDEAGIPLLIDAFGRNERYQGMQLLQRGVPWVTLRKSLTGRFFRSPQTLLNEWQTGFEMSRGIADRTEQDIAMRLAGTKVLYLDYFSGEYDHVAHLTSDEESQYTVLRHLDGLLGRMWNAIQASPLANETTLVLVSDHGMTTDPGTNSQGYNLVRFFNSPEGGGHHVLTNRHPMQMFKLRGLDPFVSEVITASPNSFYLAGKEKEYPTAKLDLDGNERAGVQLRNSDWNELQILFEQAARADLEERTRKAAENAALAVIDRNRAEWSSNLSQLGEELDALGRAIASQRRLMVSAPKPSGPEASAEKQNAARDRATLESWVEDQRGYSAYFFSMKRLLEWRPGEPFPPIVPRAMGELNTVAQLRNYVVGLGSAGLVLSAEGTVDRDRSFLRLNYLEALTSLRVRNNVQEKVGPKPVDFVAIRLGDSVLVYGDEQHQLRIDSRTNGLGVLELRAVPVQGGERAECAWAPGFPLELFEDRDLHVTGDRAQWLSGWHTDGEWLEAVHRTRYSNAVIGLHEHFLRWKPETLPAPLKTVAQERDGPALLRLIGRRRALVDDDMLVLAAEHWNFNVRNFNPGGNHGSFFRTSTHSVLMMAGGGIPRGLRIEKPYDGLSFVPTLLTLAGRLPDGHRYPGPVIEEITGAAARPAATR